jgi:hypothetical protein
VQGWDRYAYVNNNPVRYNDPSGHWIESLFDIASIIYDISDISQSGLNWGTGLALAADIGSLILPGITGGGAAVRALTHVDDVVDLTRSLNAISDTEKVINQVDNAVDASQGFMRTIDKAPTNPKGYQLDLDDIEKKGGYGLSTIANPPINPQTVFSGTGKKRAVLIPKNDIPTGLEWLKTEGTYKLPTLNENHWELWDPNLYKTLSPGEYVDHWNKKIAPELAKRAANWVDLK